MNEQTVKLIEQLASQLGTTSEFLWTVLLKQAPISSTMTLVQIIVVILGDIGLYKAHVYFSNDDNKINYEDYIGPTVFMMVGVILMGIFTVFSWFALYDVFNGYFNPEFWALDYILDKIK